jgi:glucokinase
VILAGDIGGTKCNIGLVDVVSGAASGFAGGTAGGIVDGHARAPGASGASGGAASGASGGSPGAARSPLETEAGSHANGYRISFLRRYPSLKYAQFADVIAEFLRDAAEVLGASPAGKVTAAGFGVAGPVIGRGVRVTNVDWSIEAAALERQLATPHVVLMNDLEATAYSLPWLGSADMVSLNAGVPASQAPQALIAAGTGLGESTLHWCDGRYAVTPTEGGHSDFAPRTEQEVGLWRHVKQTNKFVSVELIVSGRGFQTIHQFLNAAEHANSHQPGVDPAEITRRGLEGSCPICVQTLDLWTSIYGAEAGNLALKAFARGGMFVAGGIAPKILPKMKDGTFLRAFREKEKFEELLSRIPVQLVLNEDAPLLGAAAEASRALSAGNAPKTKA